MSKKVLHVIHSHCMGSLARLVIQLAYKLKAYDIDSRIVFIKEGEESFPQESAEGLKTDVLTKKKDFDWMLISQLRKIIKNESIDVVHSHDLEAIVYGSIAARLCLKKCLHTKHVRTYKSVRSWIYNLNTFIICVSEDIKKDLLEFNRVSDKKIQIVYNGIDIEAIDQAIAQEKRMKIRKELGFSNNTFVIGNIARCVKEEDQESIIKALKKMVVRELNAQLLIAGDGPLRQDLVKVADQYGVKDRVKFVEYNGSSVELLNAIDCLVLTTFSEGRPFTLLEAMAARKPVIATSVGANSEVIEERKNGYLVPCGFPERIHSAVMRLKAIETLAQEIGEAGRKKVEEGFTLEQMARGYDQLYRQA